MGVEIDARRQTGLRPVRGFSLPVFASAGLEARAGALAARVVRAREFLAATLGAEAAVALLVLGPEDWPGRSPHPVYGMPNCAGGNLIVAGVPNPFWQGFVDLVAAAAPHAGGGAAGGVPAGRWGGGRGRWSA